MKIQTGEGAPRIRLVSIEVVEKIMTTYRAERNDMRPVIWPISKAIEACEVGGHVNLNEQPCARPLSHLICYEDDIIAFCVAPYIQQGSYGMGVSYDRWNYQGEIIEQGATYAFVKNEQALTQFKANWRKKLEKLSEHNLGVVEATLATMHAVDAVTREPEQHQAEVDAIRMAVQMERYAFSPYTVYRERKTIKEVMNNARPVAPTDRAPGRLPAIEIVCLRIAKPAEKSEPTGRHISCRYELDPFERRQWYPSEKTHKLITVRGHVRGPENAPLRPKRERIYKVTR